MNKLAVAFIPLLLAMLACTVSTAEMSTLAKPTVTALATETTIPTADSQQPVATRCAVVTANTALNLRQAPSESSVADLRGLKHGDLLTVLTSKTDWWQVETADGRRGWVKAEYVEVCK